MKQFLFAYEERIEKKLLFKSIVLFLCLNIFLTHTLYAQQPRDTIYDVAGNYTYIVSPGYTAVVLIEAWGGGGGAYIAGGGGGAYAAKQITLNAGTYHLSVGAGGRGSIFLQNNSTDGQASFFGTEVLAVGGGGGKDNVYGAGGNAGSCIGDITFSGGNGSLLGGGGGSAFPTSNGEDANNFIGGQGGGDGGDADINLNGQNGDSPGGGGGGGINVLGGSGADGKIIITVEEVLPVLFGSINAVLENNVLNITFTTVQETNNQLFNIQASENGSLFETIATIRSKHEGLQYKGTTEYKLTIDQNGNLIFGLISLSFITLGFFKKEQLFKKPVYLSIAIFFLTLFTITLPSCAKKYQDISIKNANKKSFIRIQQVDIDGSSDFSKVIKIAEY